MSRLPGHWRPVLGHLCAAVGAVLSNFIYAQFSHDVSSDAMTYMFLYPLLLGSLGYAFLALFCPSIRRSGGYRLFANLYSSGIATLTMAAFLQGVVEIAGTGSAYIGPLHLFGWVLVATGVAALVPVLLRRNEVGR